MRIVDVDVVRKTLDDTLNDALKDGMDIMTVLKMTLFADFTKEILKHVPTIDAEPVVRCRDCKFYLNSNEKCGLVDTRLRFYETDKVWTEDSFCSWGERK